eukprot:1195905-Prorocentrum_minimum.AAC.3
MHHLSTISCVRVGRVFANVEGRIAISFGVGMDRLFMQEDYSADDPLAFYSQTDDPSAWDTHNDKLAAAARRRKNELASKKVFRKKRHDEVDATCWSMFPFVLLVLTFFVMVAGIVYEEWHVLKHMLRYLEGYDY